MDIPINYLAVLASTVAFMVLGYVWYSPMLFAKPWQRLMGMTTMGEKQGMAKLYGLMALGALVTCYVLAHFVYLASAVTVTDALTLGFWVWLGFIAPVMLGSVLWEKKPWMLYIINVGYQLVAILVASTILTLWV